MAKERWEDILEHLRRDYNREKEVSLPNLETYLVQKGHKHDPIVTLSAINHLHKEEYCNVKKSEYPSYISIEVLLEGYKYYDDNLKEKDNDEKIGF